MKDDESSSENSHNDNLRPNYSQHNNYSLYY